MFIPYLDIFCLNSYFNPDIFHILIKYNIPLSQISMHKTTKTQRCIQMYVCFTFQSLRIKHKFKNITFYIIIHCLNTAVPFVLKISTIHCKPLSSLPRARGLPMAITKLRDWPRELSPHLSTFTNEIYGHLP